MKAKYSRSELAWAKKMGKLVGIDDPRVFLETRWSEMNKLLVEYQLDLVFKPEPKPKRKKK